jgi:hypothetical protein
MRVAVVLACSCGGRLAQGVVVWGTTATAAVTAVLGGVLATRRARRARRAALERCPSDDIGV